MSNHLPHDWNAFIDAVQGLLLSGASRDELTKTFAGKVVTWSGMIDKVELDDIEPSVDIDLPSRVVQLSGGNTWTVGGMHVPVNRETMGEWQRCRSGDNVRFEATLGSNNAVFPPVDLIDLGNGRTFLCIRVTNGRLV